MPYSSLPSVKVRNSSRSVVTPIAGFTAPAAACVASFMFFAPCKIDSPNPDELAVPRLFPA